MIRGIWFSDIHLYIWPKFNAKNKRLWAQLDIIEFLLQLSMKYKCPLFFNGDLFHTPSGLSNELLSIVLPKLLLLFRKYPVECYAISGNHDFSGVNSFDHRSPSYINTIANSIKNFHNLDWETVEFEDFAVHGIPYINFNTGYSEAISRIELVKGKTNILMNHTDYSGQKDVNGIIIGKGENIHESDLRKFDLVFSGHVHLSGKLRGNIYSLGSPMAQRISDMGGVFGYWTLLSNNEPRFHDLKQPNFRFYEKEEDIDNDTDFWVKKPKEVVTDKAVRINPVDVNDRVAVTRKYLKYIGNKSRTKAALLTKIIAEVHNDSI